MPVRFQNYETGFHNFNNSTMLTLNLCHHLLRAVKVSSRAWVDLLARQHTRMYIYFISPNNSLFLKMSTTFQQMDAEKLFRFFVVIAICDIAVGDISIRQ